MTAVLYHVILIVGSRILRALNGVQRFVAQTTNWLGRVVSVERAEYFEALAYQKENLEELSVIGEIYKVRDSALAQKDWSNEHYFRLNQIFTLLAQKYYWKQVDVDKHMTAIVESGPPGYVYQAPSLGAGNYTDEEDDDGDDDDDDYDYQLT
jgi:hypothetical protein